MKLGLLAALVTAAALAPWTAAGSPLACTADCRIEGHELAFLPPVFEVRSGADVAWTSSSIGHINTDGPGAADPCFTAFYSRGEPSEPARFDISGIRLLATVAGETLECGNARALPDGSFALPYVCILHPAMRGALLVTV